MIITAPSTLAIVRITRGLLALALYQSIGVYLHSRIETSNHGIKQ